MQYNCYFMWISEEPTIPPCGGTKPNSLSFAENNAIILPGYMNHLLQSNPTKKTD